jgi:hypothetical protein
MAKTKSTKSVDKDSQLTYLHKVLNQSLKNGVVSTYEEKIIDGPRGVTILYFRKVGKNEEKIKIIGKDNEFKMTTTIGDNKNDETLSKDDLLKILKKNDNLKFAIDFAKTQKGGMWLDGKLSRPKFLSKKKSSLKKIKKSKSSKKSSSSKK